MLIANDIAVKKDGRGVGNTTRLVDATIQLLFTEGYPQVFVIEDTRASYEDFLEVLTGRLRYEHRVPTASNVFTGWVSNSNIRLLIGDVKDTKKEGFLPEHETKRVIRLKFQTQEEYNKLIK